MTITDRHKQQLIIFLWLVALIVCVVGFWRGMSLLSLSDQRIELSGLLKSKIERIRDLEVERQHAVAKGFFDGKRDLALASQVEQDLVKLLPAGQKLSNLEVTPVRLDLRSNLLKASATLDIVYGSAPEVMSQLNRSRPGWFVERAELRSPPGEGDARQRLTLTIHIFALSQGL